uniref:PiggyBac transposable element-derived protein domain-containing protein n=1 Tax=Magallana gigas TaxID=29159 RepID=A0A8W8IHW6_MAGGI
MRMPQVNPNRSIDTIDDFQFSSPSVYTCLRVRMANAQLRSPGPGKAMPAHDERESSPTEAVESDNTKVDESEDFQCEVDHVSVADKTEDDFRRKWSSEQIRNDKNSSSSSSSSSSESDSDSDLFLCSESTNSEPKIPKKILNFVTKYATKGINKKNRQDIAKICPIPHSKKLQGLSLDRFFKKIFFKGKKWYGKLEKNKVNTQMRILDALGPLSVLWSEAERISKTGKGMDSSDVIPDVCPKSDYVCRECPFPFQY